MAVLPNSNLDILTISNTLNSSSLDLGTLCRSANINIWARYKPVSFASFYRLTEDQLRSINFGLTMQRIIDFENPVAWTYTKPTGGVNSPYRMSDFLQYNTNARPFCRIDDITWNVIDTSSAANISITPTLKYGSASYEGQGGDLSYIEIYPTELTSPAGIATNLVDWYIGIYIKLTTGQIVYQFSNIKIGEIRSGNYLTIKLTNTNLINQMNNSSAGTVFTFTPFYSFTNSVNTQDKFSFPRGDKFTITKTATLRVRVVTTQMYFTSVYRGELGGGITLAGGQSMTEAGLHKCKKVYSTADTIRTWMRCTFYSNNQVTQTLSASSIQMSNGTGNTINLEGFATTKYGSLVTSIQVPQSGVTYWVSANNVIPPATCMNFPNYDGTSYSRVTLTAALRMSGYVIPASTSMLTGWNT